MSSVYPCTGRWEAFADVESIADVRHAKRLCEGCPITERCLIKALRLEGTQPVAMRCGIWGGTSRQQRHLIATKGVGHPDAHRLRHLAFGEDPADCAQCTPAEQLPVAA